MQRILASSFWPLHGAQATRAAERAALDGLPAHALMQRAGLAVARLALAVAPHARSIWIACGPGNNGGDGLEAALHLRRWGKTVHCTWMGDPGTALPDAQASWQRAASEGLTLADAPPSRADLVVDALLGIGATRPPTGKLLAWMQQMRDSDVLAVDLPTGLDADTGVANAWAVRARWTLSLLTLKPGLFTGQGRDHAGAVWWDNLGVAAGTADASLIGPPVHQPRLHASHKGSHGDVAVIGGAAGMAGAALLAARAALHHGAGRVFCGFLDPAAPALDMQQPDLMVRPWETLELAAMAVACGCGGGDAIPHVLPRVLSAARAVVLDADALNAVAADTQLQALLAARGRRGAATVLTPHPLEAARLLGTSAKDVQADRLRAAGELGRRFACTVALKGSGTVITHPDSTPRINPTGNAKLAIAGTGDVLAGMLAARLAAGEEAFDAAAHAVYLHGAAADAWPAGQALTASALAQAA